MAKGFKVKWRSTAELSVQGLDAATKRLPVARRNTKLSISCVLMLRLFITREDGNGCSPSKSLRAGPYSQLF